MTKKEQQIDLFGESNNCDMPLFISTSEDPPRNNILLKDSKLIKIWSRKLVFQLTTKSDHYALQYAKSKKKIDLYTDLREAAKTNLSIKESHRSATINSFDADRAGALIQMQEAENWIESLNYILSLKEEGAK